MMRLALSLFFTVTLFPIVLKGEDLSEKAYELNRQGMIDMSEAKFEEAIDLFHQAAELKTDYQISGRSLLYTPTFMTAWAYEKIGNTKNACHEFNLFLKRSGPLIESTKKEHVNDYLKDHCQ